MGVSEMTSYLITITDPMQIPAVVYEVRNRAAKGPLHVLLEHCESPNVVRGRNQPFENKGFTEIRRPDGGLSWYHPKTFCLIQGAPTKHPRMVAQLQEGWGELLKNLLSENGYRRENLVYRDSDLFVKNGVPERQLMGMSGWISKAQDVDVKVHRACWYEWDPVSDIAGLLRADKIDPFKFRERLALVRRGFFAYLMGELRAKEVDANGFISKYSRNKASLLQEESGGDIRGSCIMGRTDT